MVVPEPPWAELARARRGRGSGRAGAESDTVASPMQGTVVGVEVAEGDTVVAGQVICVIEAMKMENEIAAHRDGVIRGLTIEPSQAVAAGQPICVVADA